MQSSSAGLDGRKRPQGGAKHQDIGNEVQALNPACEAVFTGAVIHFNQQIQSGTGRARDCPEGCCSPQCKTRILTVGLILQSVE